MERSFLQKKPSKDEFIEAWAEILVQKKFANVPDFDVLAENPKQTADILKDRLEDEGYKKIKVVYHEQFT